jgi:hypothetical protein
MSGYSIIPWFMLMAKFRQLDLLRAFLSLKCDLVCFTRGGSEFLRRLFGASPLRSGAVLLLGQAGEGEVRQARSDPMFPYIHHQGGERYTNERAGDDVA